MRVSCIHRLTFFNNLSDRPSCYDCKFKKRYRRSDLTLWDCFPIEKFTKQMDGKGTTRILVQSEKGAEIMKQVADNLNLIPVETDKLTEGVREMFHSVPMNPRRNLFFRRSECDGARSLLPEVVSHDLEGEAELLRSPDLSSPGYLYACETGIHAGLCTQGRAEMMLSGKEKVDKKKSRELFLWDNDLQRPAERSIPQGTHLTHFDKTDRVRG